MARGFDGIGLGRRLEQTERREDRGEEGGRNFKIHSVRDLTTEGTEEHGGNTQLSS